MIYRYKLFGTRNKDDIQICGQ